MLDERHPRLFGRRLDDRRRCDILARHDAG
jgi:hypothetical protein